MKTVVVNCESKPHVVFIPFPAQSHIKCMLKLARLLHHKGLHITFVNTVFNHKRLLNSGGPDCLDGAPGFQFETIPDGLPYDPDNSNVDVPQDIGELCNSILTNCLAPFLDLVVRLDSPVTCIISDGLMPFTIDAAEKLRIPIMHFWTVAACAFMAFREGPNLVEKGVIPLKDESCFTNGYLDTLIDWIPGMEGFCLKDFPSYVRTIDPNESGYNIVIKSAETTRKASHIILHTFEELESTIIKALKDYFPNLYTVGPLQLLLNKTENDEETKNLDIKSYSLWKEEPECIKWLEMREPNSVIYVNFGSITVMSLQELLEFGWGLANSNHYFIWIIRPDLVIGESAILPVEFKEVIEKRGFIASWCPQEEVLNHPSVGGFLTHCGWGSIIESLSAGVPMICWPFYGDQLTNCRQMCKEWDVGMEIGSNVKRDNVEKLVRKLMGGIEGKRIRNKAMEWKRITEIATSPKGSSLLDIEKLVDDINAFSRN
ncbi:UDP-glycosyltransferase 85C1 [Lactuca sativa]|nr:UDP-glycosyltransferase 85C1 [Lactuca sativa]